MFDKATFEVLIQGGSFALVVAIVCWILYWVPKWIDAYWKAREREDDVRMAVAREQTSADKEMAATNSAVFERIATLNAAALDRATITHANIQDRTLKAMQDETGLEREVCERRHKELMEVHRDAIKVNAELHQQTRHHLNNLAQAAQFHQQIISGLELLKGSGIDPTEQKPK